MNSIRLMVSSGSWSAEAGFLSSPVFWSSETSFCALALSKIRFVRMRLMRSMQQVISDVIGSVMIPRCSTSVPRIATRIE